MVENKIPYIQVHRESILDNSISDSAFRVYVFLLSLDDGFEVSELNIGRNLQRVHFGSIKDHIHELEAEGWITFKDGILIANHDKLLPDEI